jgi:hypothetical protein
MMVTSRLSITIDLSDICVIQIWTSETHRSQLCIYMYENFACNGKADISHVCGQVCIYKACFIIHAYLSISCTPDSDGISIGRSVNDGWPLHALATGR